MKKLLIISAAVCIALSAVMAVGFADKDDAGKRAMINGNGYYEREMYAEALAEYETGLASGPENTRLNFNAAQAAYMTGEYAKAAGYYEKGDKNAETYTNYGNIFVWAGDAAEDAETQAEYYMYALSAYYEGILEYPQDMPLKYNFEYVKKKLEELLEYQDEQSDDSDDGDESDQDESDGDEGEG
ncbi:MAG: hypothetical protein FWG34_12880, partial [Oscillospiraceae bacterium]|nr:hypothetical protein [Oscillospiraceae bacterium]